MRIGDNIVIQEDKHRGVIQFDPVLRDLYAVALACLTSRTDTRLSNGGRGSVAVSDNQDLVQVLRLVWLHSPVKCFAR
jgi:hypothetical protein